ncbi:MAG TPA: TolC family protein [Vicinamibacterales bacterium]|nr:TolC family protein [Vicinamibacterales bacterium]
MNRQWMPVIACLSLLPGPAAAQPVPVTLTVTDAVARAFEASHRLAEAGARQAAADATRRVRQTASRPTASATAGYTRTNHVDEFSFASPGGGLRVLYPDVPDNLVTRLSAQWPIYTAGRADALERAAAAEARAAGADLETARLDLRFEVQRAYWALATAREAVRVLEESVARADAQVTDARSRLDVGLVPPSDVLVFEAQRSRDQLQLIEAQSQREAALVDLRRLLGLAPGAAIDLADRLDAPLLSPEAATASASPDPDPFADTLVAEALRQRPERQALALRVEGSEARRAAASAGNRPTIALGGGVDLARPNPRIFPREAAWQSSWDLGVNVSWTLFDGGRTRAEVAEATATAQAAEARLDEVESLVAADVRLRQLDLRTGVAAVRTSEDGLRAAAEARRVIGERFAVGVATTTDVLVAQDQLLLAELARARSLASLRLAEARLQRALGRP